MAKASRSVGREFHDLSGNIWLRRFSANQCIIVFLSTLFLSRDLMYSGSFEQYGIGQCVTTAVQLAVFQRQGIIRASSLQIPLVSTTGTFKV